MQQGGHNMTLTLNGDGTDHLNISRNR